MKFSKLKIIVFLLINLTVVLISQDIIINEFAASNVSIFPEMLDFDDYVDWIELRNTIPEQISLENYFLSDNVSEPLKWQFPSETIISPNGYLLIWADDYNDGPGNEYIRPYWPWDNFTTQHFHTNFKLNKEGEQICLSRALPNEPVEFIAVGSYWKFLDDGSDQGTDWTSLEFDDSNWNGGFAELGYGDNDETTTVDFGPDENGKYITTYFRHQFLVDDPDNFQTLQIRIKRDDGGIVYLNGAEIYRSNMPEGNIYYNTLANNTVSGNEEDTFFAHTIIGIELQNGENIIAVEIHQADENSSDISFDLELTCMGFYNVEILDSVSFSEQLKDVSSGRSQNLENWEYFGEPTPGGENNTVGIDILAYSGSLTSSLESGFYSGTQFLELFSDEFGNIYYTTDGSMPGTHSTLYDSPIQIEETIVIKCRLFEENKLPGEILTLSMFVDEPSTIPTVSLSIDPLILWDENLGIYENEYKQREIPVTIEYFTPDMELGFSVNAGARLGGLNIWTKPQKPFTIYTRSRFEDEFIHYQLFENKPITQFSRIVFRNGGDDWEETLLRDPMTESIANGRMECGYMAYTPSALFLNGEYWGIYNIREKFNDHYFYENFNADPNQIDHLEYTSTQSGTQLMVIEGDLANYTQFINFINENELNSIENYNHLEHMMNIDSFIDFITMTIFTANTSWGHNREWWRPKTENGQWQWLLVDIDRGFNNYNTYSNQLDDLIDDYGLFSDLLSSTLFKNRFIQRASAHFNSTFSPLQITEIVDSLSLMIEDEIPRHIARWGNEGSISSLNDWYDELNEIVEFTEDRKSVVLNQFIEELNLDGIIDLQFELSPSEAGIIMINGIPLNNSNPGGTFIKNIPLIIKAIPNPGYQFISWNGIAENQEFEYNCNSDSLFTGLFQSSTDIILQEIISENVQLLSGQHYALNQNLTIESNGILSIPEGVDIKMPDDGQIIVRGKLIINGTEDNPVRILPNYDSGVEHWGAINFDHSMDTSYISYTNISGATTGYYPTVFKGSVSGKNSSIVLDHLQIENVEFPVYIEGGYVKLTNSEITSEFICDYINVKSGHAEIVNNSFFGRTADNTDAIDLDNVINGVINGNWIYDFSGYNSDGIDIGEQSENINIVENLIYHSQDKGISIGQHSTVSISDNIFIGNNTGIAVKDNSSADIFNNTFYFNDTTISCFEKNDGQGGGHVEIVNSILSQNLEIPIFTDEHSTYSVTYSLSDTEPIEGENNLFMTPHFIAPGSYNVEISLLSPCIDTGSPELLPEEDGSISDIGANYVYHESDYPFEIPNRLIGHLKINEILAKNETINSDENGEYEDWIEIYYHIASTLNLQGFSLTDDIDQPQKWTFPDLQISNRGHLLLWADNEPDDGETHLNFKLSSEGEGVYLFDPEGYLLDSITFGEQADDVSFGRINDGNGGWEFLEFPSPGEFNSYPNETTLGDLNSDGVLNVVDIVAMVYLVLDGLYMSLADMNSDSMVNVVDIVQLAEIILGNTFFFDADMVSIKQKNGTLSVHSNGQIGAIQILLSHAIGFNFDLTDSAFISEYRQDEFSTSIIVVAPSGNEIFYTEDTYNIEKIIAANSEIIIDVGLPVSFRMGNVYPNPFNANAQFKFSIPYKTKVKISIFDLMGKEIGILTNRYYESGTHSVNINGSNFASGIYFVKLDSKEFTDSQKILFIK